MVFWFTGLSGAGKSTLAKALCEHLRGEGHATLLLDGDDARRTLCSDLGFSMSDRKENVRRIASCAKIAEESGIIVCVACISPLAEHRRLAKNIISDFHEIFVNADLEVCRRRDPKGNYKKCIPDYTGISSKYEEPLHPDLVIDTCNMNEEESLRQILAYIEASACLE